MFGPGALTLLVLLLVVSVAARQASLSILSLALVLAAGLSRLWERHCLTGVEYRRRLSRDRAEFGDSVELEIEIVNRKVLPLAWLEIEDEVPAELPPARGRVYASHKPSRALLCGLVALRPYERVRRHYSIPCHSRGEHHFGPVRLRTGDLFGLVSRETMLEQTNVLVVYPRVVPVTDLGLPAHQPLGDLRTRSWLFEDPGRTVGVREYRPGDSPRRIHWPASARTQQLQARVYESTTSHRVMVFLNVQSTPRLWWDLNYDPDALELTITTAASIANWCVDHGYQVGLATNGMHRFSATKVGVPPSDDPALLAHILEALGRLQPTAARPFEATLAEGARRLVFGTTVVVVTAVLVAPVAAELLALRRRGHAVTLVLTGREDARTPLSLDGVTIRRVVPTETWRELPGLPLGAR